MLAPQKHVHSHECNGSCGDAHLPSKPAEIYYTDYSNQKEGVSLRRDHAPGTVDTIRYAQDVQGEFGAGESSRISPAHQLLINAVTAIPFTGATHDAPAGILLGSQNSKKRCNQNVFRCRLCNGMDVDAECISGECRYN